MKDILLICAAFSIFWFQVNGSCIADGDRNPNGANVTKQSISDAILKYTIDQSKAMVSENGNTNLFTSPFSIWNALASAYLGSRQGSSAELGTVLGLQGYDKAEVEQAMLELVEDVVSETGDKFLVANKLAFNNLFKIRNCLIEGSDSVEFEAMNFVGNSEVERKKLNAWVLSKTENIIKDLLPPGSINTDTLFVILNAVYFKGSWKREFKKDLVSQAPFNSQNGNKNNIDMMFQRADHLHYHEPNSLFSTIDLPYVDGNYSMSIILPGEGQTVDTVLNDLTPEILKTVFNNLYTQKTDLKLPKFKLETSYELTTTLQSLGAKQMFKYLNVSGIMKNVVGVPAVSSVVHKAFMSVDEEGTEAAAATGVLVASFSAISYPTFIVNRPFITVIREVKTNTVMFMGVVRNL